MRHIRVLVLSALIVLILANQGALARRVSTGEAIAGAGYGAVGASLARAEEAVCRSMINYSHVRGAFGEAVMDRVALGFQRGRGWQAISISSKPQGIDGIYIKRNSIGIPRGLLVGEAKFGTARLGMTRDGRQLSSTWTSPRLNFEASRYQRAGSSVSVSLRARPRGLTSNPDIVKVRLSDGRNGYFWRTVSDSWAYDGPKGTLMNAQSAATRDGLYLQAAADGKISYRQRVFKIDVTRNTISVKMHDAKSASSGTVKLKEVARVKIDSATRRGYMAGTKAEIARQLMTKNSHLTENEAKMIARSATRKSRHLEAILRQQNRSYWVSAFIDSGKAAAMGGVLTGGINMAVQMYSEGKIDWGQTGSMALIGSSSAGAGTLAHHLIVGSAINNAVAHQFFIQTADVVGLPTGMLAADIIGQGASGIVGSAVFAFGLYLSGNMEGGDAARVAAAGTIGSAAGMVSGTAAIALVASVGTAGTGAAISSLSGAAANSAALAWLGGGTVAAGGGGVAMGSIILSGGIAAVAVAASAVVYGGYAKYDDIQANKRHEYNADYLMSNADLLKKLCRRQWFSHVGLMR